MSAAQGRDAIEWEGGSVDDVIAMFTGPALAVCVEVRSGAKTAGEIHIVAGGVAEVLAGELRGDDALAQLRGVSPLGYRIEPRLPNPEDGMLFVAGPNEGSLAERNPVALMRYCEDHVLTCVLELAKGGDRATIDYRRGEIASTRVNGSESSDRLPEVMGWNEGRYRIITPKLAMPAPASAAPAPRPAQAAPAPSYAPVNTPPPQVSAPSYAIPAGNTPAPVPVTAAASPGSGPARKPSPAPAAPLRVPAPDANANRTIFGYAAPPAKEEPLAVQTASSPASTRSTVPYLPPDEAAAESRSTTAGMPVDIFDKARPERTTAAGVTAVAPPVAAEPPARPATPVPAQPAVLTTLPGREAHSDPRSTAPGFSSSGPSQPAAPRSPSPVPPPRAATPVAAVPAPAPAPKPAAEPAPKAAAPVARAEKPVDKAPEKAAAKAPTKAVTPAKAAPAKAVTPAKAGAPLSAARKGEGRPLTFHIALGIGVGLVIVGLYWLITNVSGP